MVFRSSLQACKFQDCIISNVLVAQPINGKDSVANKISLMILEMVSLPLLLKNLNNFLTLCLTSTERR
jgi:hypothetical protein